MVLAFLHIVLTISIYMFDGSLLRIELKCPRYTSMSTNRASTTNVQRYNNSFSDDEDYGGIRLNTEKIPPLSTSPLSNKKILEKTLCNGSLSNGSAYQTSLKIAVAQRNTNSEELDSKLDKKFLLTTNNNNIVVHKPKILTNDNESNCCYSTIKQPIIKNYNSNLQQQYDSFCNSSNTLQNTNISIRSIIEKKSSHSSRSPSQTQRFTTTGNNFNSNTTRSFFVPSSTDTQDHAIFRRSSQPLITSSPNLILTSLTTNNPCVEESDYVVKPRDEDFNFNNGKSFAASRSLAARYAFLYGVDNVINGGGTSDGGTVSTTATTTTSPVIGSGNSSGQTTPPPAVTVSNNNLIKYVSLRNPIIKAAPLSPARAKIIKVDVVEKEANNNNRDRRHSEGYTSEDFREGSLEEDEEENSSKNMDEHLGHPLVSVV